MATILTIDQQTEAYVKFTDRAGNLADIDGTPVWASSDTNVATVEADEDGHSAVIKSVNVGVAQITVRADADLGDGIREVVAVADLEVFAGEAVTAGIEFQAPQDKA